ncbi:MAG: ABC transporter substrate-binding protein [Rhodospirillales bacterium]|nr:ABC transporter substrate-binding protein [Rhodospirillales bacterium]
MFIRSKMTLLCASAALALGVAMSSGASKAAEMGSMHIAFGDIPGADMLGFMIAAKRAESRGVKLKISFLQSEDLASQAIVSGQADIGVGTPYALIQKVKAPIRMFYQLSKLAFFPIVNTEKYKGWKDLDGQPMYTHARGSGTEAIMNLMAMKNNIKYSAMSYVPGSAVRAGAMLQGRIDATIVDAERRTLLMREGKGKFALLPLPKIDASDEALYANTEFMEKNEEAINILLEELVLTWREINKNPGYVSKARAEYNLLPDMPASDAEGIDPYYAEAVETKIFDDNGGGEKAILGDFEFYDFAGTIKGDTSKLTVEEFWNLAPLNKALDKLGRM